MNQQRAIDVLNQFAAEMGLYPRRQRHPFVYFAFRKASRGKRVVYAFGYTPWKTRDPETGKEGFFALKYRVYRNGQWKLVKSVRFGKRKIAKKRAWEWHQKYYNGGDC